MKESILALEVSGTGVGPKKVDGSGVGLETVDGSEGARRTMNSSGVGPETLDGSGVGPEEMHSELVSEGTVMTSSPVGTSSIGLGVVVRGEGGRSSVLRSSMGTGLGAGLACDGTNGSAGMLARALCAKAARTLGGMQPTIGRTGDCLERSEAMNLAKGSFPLMSWSVMSGPPE